MSVGSSSNWMAEAFFDPPFATSVDGGTTTAGPLWHSTNTRWGHSLHTMCSYHGMFPAKMARYFISRYTSPFDVVLDPFSGRGTVALEARVCQRRSICNDLNPLAFMLSSAKACPPSWSSIMSTIEDLERRHLSSVPRDSMVSDDIKMLYHPRTLQQIVSLRDEMLAQPLRDWSPELYMVAGALAGIMHGSARRDGSSQYLSISMPNTFSMSPAYVAKYIDEKGLVAPDQDVFELLRDKVARLYLDDVSGPDGVVHHEDAGSLLADEAKLPDESVDLVLTSPPYLKVVNYATANWIRLWLLGVDDVGRERGEGRRRLNAALDHRHTYSSYVGFIRKLLLGTERVLKDDGVAVVVIGDVSNPGRDTRPLAADVWEDVKGDVGLDLVTMIEDFLPVQNKVSRIWGETKGQATSRDCVLVLARPGAGTSRLEGFANWDEPYSGGGPTPHILE